MDIYINSTNINLDTDKNKETKVPITNLNYNENMSEIIDISLSSNLIENSMENPTISITTPEGPKNPFFQLIILQVRLIKRHLKIYTIISEKITIYSNFTILIDKYENKSRKLQESSSQMPVELYINENEIGPGQIYELTSSTDDFKKSDRIVLKQIQIPNSDCEMKVLNDNYKILDTQENERMIEEGEIIDFNKDFKEIQINQYYIVGSSTNDCKLDLKSNTSIIGNNKKITLRFIEKDNKNSGISTECTLPKDNNIIPCSLNSNIDSNYNLDIYTDFIEKEIFYISPEKAEDNFNLVCKKNGGDGGSTDGKGNHVEGNDGEGSDGNKEENNINPKKSESSFLSKPIIFIIVFFSAVIIAIIITVIIYCTKKKSNLEGKNKNAISVSVNGNSSSTHKMNEYEEN